MIGAGPIGLEAALAACARGFEVNVFERGSIGDAVRQWGHVRMFSPFEMNATALGIQKLQQASVDLPEAGALLRGSEFRERYLLPLANTLPLGVLHPKTPVLAIGRSHVLKGDHIGAAARGDTPFRLLIADDAEGERIVQADVILDCSGTYGQPNGLGHGGIPAPGERAASDRIFYGIPDFDSSERDRYAGRRVLVVGAGHSGATVVTNLARITAANSSTQTHWLVRTSRDLPAPEIPADPLLERARVASAANCLVTGDKVKLHRGSSIESIAQLAGMLGVTIISADSTQVLEVDEIVVSTGFRPDITLTRELQVQTCWATEGTYPLAASMLGESGADCLETPVFGAEMLRHPEPGFFTLGMKSYGRAPNFLLRTGHEQIAIVLDSLGNIALEAKST